MIILLRLVFKILRTIDFRSDAMFLSSVINVPSMFGSLVDVVRNIDVMQLFQVTMDVPVTYQVAKENGWQLNV